MSQEKIAKILIEKGYKLFNSSPIMTSYTKNEESDALLNDLVNYPHAIVLACLMDKQIKTEKAWLISYKIKQHFKTFQMKDLSQISREEYKKMFTDENLHRFNNVMADVFYSGVQTIQNLYNGDASQIWENKPSSASIVYRLLEFKGVGVKIATMTANILARDFKIPMSDYYSIDISVDVHIRRVFQRIGFVQKNLDNDLIIYKARELNPTFPGILDFLSWEIGREWCRPTKPDCGECYLNELCPKIATEKS